MWGARIEMEELKVAWKVPLDEHYPFIHLTEMYQVPPLNHHPFIQQKCIKYLLLLWNLQSNGGRTDKKVK